MGIYGFGGLRDRFSEEVRLFASNESNVNNLLRTNGESFEYVACFDITPFVVKAARLSDNVDAYDQTFVTLLDDSNEIAFIRQYRPLELCFTLDNGSPRAKRQTQFRRLVEPQSISSVTLFAWKTWMVWIERQ